MAKHNVSRSIPSLFHPENSARNGRLPNAAIPARIARAYNQIATQQRKLIFCKSQSLRAMEDFAGGIDDPIWPFYFRTGENVDAIEAQVGVTQTGNAGSGPATGLLLLTRISTSTIINLTNGEGRVTYAGDVTPGAAIGCSDIAHVTVRINGLVANEEYAGAWLATNGLRLAYMSVAEVAKPIADDSVAVICNPSLFVREGPIYAAQFADLQQAANRLWKHNASHLLSWCVNYEIGGGGDAITNSTSYVDVIPNNAEIFINTINRGTLSRPNSIPVRMAVYATRSGGAGTTADFRLFDGTNSIEILNATITASPVFSWVSGSGVMSGTPANWRMQMRTDNAGTQIRVGAWSLFQWEA
jgi:hypothetical protein